MEITEKKIAAARAKTAHSHKAKGKDKVSWPVNAGAAKVGAPDKDTGDVVITFGTGKDATAVKALAAGGYIRVEEKRAGE